MFGIFKKNNDQEKVVMQLGMLLMGLMRVVAENNNITPADLNEMLIDNKKNADFCADIAMSAASNLVRNSKNREELDRALEMKKTLESLIKL